MSFARLTTRNPLKADDAKQLASDLTDLICRDLRKQKDLTAMVLESSATFMWAIGGSRYDSTTLDVVERFRSADLEHLAAKFVIGPQSKSDPELDEACIAPEVHHERLEIEFVLLDQVCAQTVHIRLHGPPPCL